jgi:hypothetical protein
LAKNRYGWQKRAKELARKQKQEDKIRRRQGKTQDSTAVEKPAAPAEDELPVTATEEIT